MTFLDFFAGIGGFRRGMEQAGHKCVGFCEYDKYAVMSYTAMHLCTDEQRAYLSTLTLKERQREILKDEYRNGEWFADDIRTVNATDIPKADCWCFGFPCQDISVAGKQVGFYGNRSSLFFRVMYLVGQMEEAKKPAYLLVENVKNLLSVNGGWDFARLLTEMDRGGYDAEWQLLNSADFGVPQNRERVFIAGHLRGRSSSEIFPVERADGADNLQVDQIGQIFGTEAEQNPSGGRIYGTVADRGGYCNEGAGSRTRDEPAVHSADSTIKIIAHSSSYRRNRQVFDADGITETLDTCQGGGRGHHVAIRLEPIGGIYTQVSKDFQRGIFKGGVRCLKAATHDAGVAFAVMGIIDHQGRLDKVVEPTSTVPTLRSQTHGNLPEVVLRIEDNNDQQGLSSSVAGGLQRGGGVRL